MTQVDSAAANLFALDVQGLDTLRHQAATAPRDSLEAAAKQFEAIFINTMLKSMRDASPQSELTNSRQSDFYQGLMDQQWSQQLAERGIGLADQLIAQLSDRLGGSD